MALAPLRWGLPLRLKPFSGNRPCPTPHSRFAQLHSTGNAAGVAVGSEHSFRHTPERSPQEERTQGRIKTSIGLGNNCDFTNLTVTLGARR